MTKQTLEERFWEKVSKRAPDECWPWLGAFSERGYGQLWTGRRVGRATQISWSLHNETAWPKGKIACHRCDNPRCVNPSHIWPGTLSENQIDAVQKRRNHFSGRDTCSKGHALAGDNLGFAAASGSGRPVRICRTCRREWDREAYQRRKIERDRTIDGARIEAVTLP